MANNPVQVVLNAQAYADTPRDKKGGGGKKDFFFAEDAKFREHKDALQQQVSGIRKSLGRDQVGYVKVSLRRSALAKSHRPVDSLLNPDRVKVIGGLDLGQMIVEVTDDSLAHIARDISRAALETRTRVNKQGKIVPAPLTPRHEVGAVEKFELYGPEDRRQFSLAEAVAQLRDPRRGGAYYVELFEMPPAFRSDWNNLDPRKRSLFESFEQGVAQLGSGVIVERLDRSHYITNYLGVRLVKEFVTPGSPFEPRADADKTYTFDADIERHALVLRFLSLHPLVKQIRLAPIPRRSRSTAVPARVRPAKAEIPAMPKGRLPIVGIIDGGIGPALSPWVIGRWNYLAPEDQDLEHGTFIGGLLVAGAQLNGSDVCPEPDGCALVDIDVFPREDDPAAFARYYPEGAVDFFDEVETAIIGCKDKYGVRVFNFSINDTDVISPASISYAAQRLDAIAHAADVIIVISAGNLDGIERDEWAASPVKALQQLASPRGDETLNAPSDSVRNVTVAAVNPPGLTSSVCDAPARYSRRRFHAGIGVKPEFGHYGGSGTTCPHLGSGLFSVMPNGTIVEHCGTSYAAPLIAKTIATLDAMIDGRVPRETLLALAVHHARLRGPLTHKLFKDLSRKLVGFGQLGGAQEILQSDDHQITLLFHGTLMPDKTLDFQFPWPKALSGPDGISGFARMTLAYTPPVLPAFGAEAVRVNLDAHLQQDDGKGGWSAIAHEAFLDENAGNQPFEKERIEHGLKWSPVKCYETTKMRGKGTSSNCRVSVEYLTRALVEYPKDGILFTLLLTIEDHTGDQKIFQQVRREIQDSGARLQPIRTATRVTPQVR